MPWPDFGFPRTGCLLLALYTLACGPQAPTQAPLEPPSESASGGGVSDGEARPAIHDDLADPATREAAIERLISQYDETTQHGTRADAVLAFTRQHGAALTQTYVTGHPALSPRSRLTLIQLLVSLDDPVTTPALALAIERYGKTSEGVEEAIGASQAAKKQKSPELAKALMVAFEALDMSDKDGRRFSGHLEQAMLFNATTDWTPKLQEVLKRPMVRPERFDDKPAVREFNNQRFWQITAAKVLGRLQEPSAARSLFGVMCDPDKRDIQVEATRAFSGLGAPAVDLAHELLAGTNSALVADATRWQPELSDAHIVLAAKLLGDLAHPSSRDRLLDAWHGDPSPEARVFIIKAVAHLPRSERSIVALKETYAQTKPQATLFEGEGALEALVRSSVLFFDPSLVDWMGPKIGHVPTNGARRFDIQRALIMSVSELLVAEQSKNLMTASQKYGGRTGTPAFATAAEMAKRCGEDANCYLEALQEGPSEEESFAAIKAATMVGVYGTAKHRDALLQKLGDVEYLSVATRVTDVVLHLTRDYDQGVENALLARMKGEEDPTMLSVLERAVFRIRARK